MFTLPHRRFRFYFQTLEPLHLRGYKGSPFRGLFGHSLKKIVCPFKQPDCTPCLLRHQCYYLKLFETPSLVTPDRVPSNGTDHFPHPFILVPPLDQRENLATGDTFTVELVLLEVVLPALPYIILAFEKMGEVGIGKERNCFQLTHLEVSHGTDWTTVFTAAEGILQLPDPLAVTLTSYPEVIQQVQLTTCTPLRLKQAGHYITKELPFTVLIRRLLRRLDDLSRLYGPGQIVIVKTLLELAETITISDHQLHWIDIRRFSNRQQQHMNLGGLEGSITYTGNLTSFAPWLVWGEILHIGQATSFGFGKYSLKFS